jgi:hypothetical protein
MAIRSAARSKCQLARAMHKLLPLPASKRAVGAHPARSGAQPARIEGYTLDDPTIRQFSLAIKSLHFKSPAKSLICKQVTGERSRDAPTPQVVVGLSVKARRPQFWPSARATPKFRSIEFHFVRKARREAGASTGCVPKRSWGTRGKTDGQVNKPTLRRRRPARPWLGRATPSGRRCRRSSAGLSRTLPRFPGRHRRPPDRSACRMLR